MSQKYPGGIITKNPTAPTATVAKGIWTAQQAASYAKQGIWPRSPGAPTIGTATDAAAGGKVNITFTAPTDTGSASITTYTATSTPGSITGTSATSPIQVSGLTNGTSYTFKVTATNGAGTGPSSASSNSATPTAAVAGQQAYDSSGTFTWVALTGVTSVSVQGGGGGGGGGKGYNGYNGGAGGSGGMGYANNYSVTPGSSYTVTVGTGGAGGNGYGGPCADGFAGGATSFASASFSAGGGGGGGVTSACPTGGGNGHAGSGGSGSYQSGNAGQAGFKATRYNAAYCYVGCTGYGGAALTMSDGVSYGAGGNTRSNGSGFAGSSGRLRIMWPGTRRQYPSTCVPNE